MKLIQVKNTVYTNQIGLAVKGQSHITIATVYRQSSLAGYRADRTARMIEKMDKTYNIIDYLVKNTSMNTDFEAIAPGTFEELREIADFIEHGDPEPEPEDKMVTLEKRLSSLEMNVANHENQIGQLEQIKIKNNVVASSSNHV